MGCDALNLVARVEKTVDGIEIGNTSPGLAASKLSKGCASTCNDTTSQSNPGLLPTAFRLRSADRQWRRSGFAAVLRAAKGRTS